ADLSAAQDHWAALVFRERHGRSVFQEADERSLGVGDAGHLDVLLGFVRQVGITWAEIQCGDAERGEARYVRPAVLRLRRTSYRSGERAGQRAVESGPSARCRIDDLQVPFFEHATNVRVRVRLGPIRCKPEVDRD